MSDRERPPQGGNQYIGCTSSDNGGAGFYTERPDALYEDCHASGNREGGFVSAGPTNEVRPTKWHEHAFRFLMSILGAVAAGGIIYYLGWMP